VGEPFERIAMDILGPLPIPDQKNKFILVIGDYFTKWTHAVALPNQETGTVAQAFVEQFLCVFVTPRILHSDRGTNCESNMFKEICGRRTPPYNDYNIIGSKLA
jgi:hypothetical protein